jgi:hypothetical protein
MADKVVPIVKPDEFDLNQFKSKRGVSASVDTLQGALSTYNLKEANDFVRFHPNEDDYWSAELCFVVVPVKGQKKETLHLINEDLALSYLRKGKLKWFRLALATKPFDVFFLCQVPSLNLDNDWNSSNLLACERAKTQWIEVTSLKGEGQDGYQIRLAKDQSAFPEPTWPKQSLEQLIKVTFAGRMILNDDHPGLLRLIGAKQELG